ncbi:MAG: hypothetical protein J6Z43_08695 [Clostridiales bacterium]|nr:hypothetical protein [Clostridiales bacterium]
MRKLECTGCGANLQWNGEDQIITCASCGSQFLMHVKEQTPQERMKKLMAAAAKGGDIMERPANDGRIGFVTYMPEGWHYISDLPQDYGLNRLTPVTCRIEMSSDDNTCCIAYISQNAYIHLPPTPMNANFQNQIHSLEFVRMRSLMRASDYCDYMVERWLPFRPSAVVDEKGEDDQVLKWRKDALKTIDAAKRANAHFDYKKRIYRAEYKGTTYLIQTETEIYNDGVQLWCTDYEMYVYAPEKLFNKVIEEYDKVRSSIHLADDFRKLTNEAAELMNQAYSHAQNVVSNSMMNMAMARQQSAFRQADIIRRTNDYTTQVARDIMAGNAASQDRVANMHSEMINGVNSFRGTDGNIYQASTNWDHVFQGGAANDTFVMTEGEWLKPGVDFEELGKIKGGNY